MSRSMSKLKKLLRGPPSLETLRLWNVGLAVAALAVVIILGEASWYSVINAGLYGFLCAHIGTINMLMRMKASNGRLIEANNRLLEANHGLAEALHEASHYIMREGNDAPPTAPKLH